MKQYLKCNGCGKFSENTGSPLKIILGYVQFVRRKHVNIAITNTLHIFNAVKERL